jgi:XTP/dITP diphosphohydrolase
MRLVLASNNAKKLAELQVMFAPLALDIVTQGSLGVSEAEEPHHSFIENALAKARHAAQATGCVVIADDSGLCVDALGGAPGVVSAHFAPLEQTQGRPKFAQPPRGADDVCRRPGGALPSHPADREVQRAVQDAANNGLLLQRLQGVADRRARFVSTLVALRSADDPEPLVAVGRWHGEILMSSRGQGGFGYDPLMFIPALGCAVAELDAATKNTHSHRALAAQQMLVLMREAWHLA